MKVSFKSVRIGEMFSYRGDLYQKVAEGMAKCWSAVPGTPLYLFGNQVVVL